MSRETIQNKICEQVIPTDIRVFYEDGRPYIYYKGKVVSRYDEWEIEIPKMDMVLNTLERIVDIEYTVSVHGDMQRRTPVCNQFYAEHDVAYRMRIAKRKMTQRDIERELGYKVDIIGE